MWRQYRVRSDDGTHRAIQTYKSIDLLGIAQLGRIE
jgi:hypothetical protein